MKKTFFGILIVLFLLTSLSAYAYKEVVYAGITGFIKASEYGGTSFDPDSITVYGSTCGYDLLASNSVLSFYSIDKSRFASINDVYFRVLPSNERYHIYVKVNEPIDIQRNVPQASIPTGSYASPVDYYSISYNDSKSINKDKFSLVKVESTNEEIFKIIEKGNNSYIHAIGVGSCDVNFSLINNPKIIKSIKFYSVPSYSVCEGEEREYDMTGEIDDQGESIEDINNIESLDPELLQVDYLNDGSALYTGINEGYAKVKYYSSEKEQTKTIYVSKSIITGYKGYKVKISKNVLKNAVNVINGYPFDEDINNIKKIQISNSFFEVSQGKVVDNNIEFTPTRLGVYFIKIYTDNYTYGYKVMVKKGISVKSIKLDNSKLYLNTGDKYQLNATINPKNATYKSIKWVSSDPSVAYVSQVGKVYAKGRGTATITAITDGGNKKAYCKVYVKQPVKSVKLNKSKLTLYLGKQDTLIATVLPEDANNKNLIWTSSDNSVVSVSQNGKIKAKGIGTAIIKVTSKDSGNTTKSANDSDFTATCDITVTYDPAESITLNKYYIELDKGFYFPLKATISPDTALQDVTWEVENKNIAIVSKTGIVKGVGDGTTFVTATSKALNAEGKRLKARCKVRVYYAVGTSIIKN